MRGRHSARRLKCLYPHTEGPGLFPALGTEHSLLLETLEVVVMKAQAIGTFT